MGQGSVMLDITTAMNLLPLIKSNFKSKPFTLYFKFKWKSLWVVSNTSYFGKREWLPVDNDIPFFIKLTYQGILNKTLA